MKIRIVNLEEICSNSVKFKPELGSTGHKMIYEFEKYRYAAS